MHSPGYTMFQSEQNNSLFDTFLRDSSPKYVGYSGLDQSHY